MLMSTAFCSVRRNHRVDSSGQRNVALVYPRAVKSDVQSLLWARGLAFESHEPKVIQTILLFGAKRQSISTTTMS